VVESSLFLGVFLNNDELIVCFNPWDGFHLVGFVVEFDDVFFVAAVLRLVEDHRIEKDTTFGPQQIADAVHEEFLEQKIGHGCVLEDIDHDEVVLQFGLEHKFEGVVNYDLQVRNLVEPKIGVGHCNDFGINLYTDDFAFKPNFVGKRFDYAATGHTEYQNRIHRPYLFKTDVLEALAQNTLQAAVRIIGVLRIEHELAIVPGNFKVFAHGRWLAVDHNRNEIAQQFFDHRECFFKNNRLLLILRQIRWMKKQIYQFIFFRLMGWKIIGTINPEIKKCVLMVLPHTSWHDFYIGLFSRGIIRLDMHWVGKKELFGFPFGFYFRWMGGAPLDRSGGLNKVDSIAQIFEKREVFRMAIAPEGTRKQVAGLKTGFYYIALKANVPIIPVAFDYRKKQVRLGAPFYPTRDYEADLQKLLPHFKDAAGKIAAQGFKV